MSPDRVVIGTETDRAAKLMQRLYQPFLLRNMRVIFMDIPSAELTKYASNAMLATRISFMNEIANLCEKVGADVDSVRKGMGSDARIGQKFLYAGCGYGGSCFPKDVRALARVALENGLHMDLIEAVDKVNERQKEVLFSKVSNLLGGHLSGRTVAVLGLSFKPETDDMREAPSLVLIESLLDAGAVVRVFDPVAMDECRRRIGDRVSYCSDLYDAAIGSDALCLVTEWRQFRMPDWHRLKSIMRGSAIVDGRNIWNRAELEELGFEYSRIG